MLGSFRWTERPFYARFYGSQGGEDALPQMSPWQNWCLHLSQLNLGHTKFLTAKDWGSLEDDVLFQDTISLILTSLILWYIKNRGTFHAFFGFETNISTSKYFWKMQSFLKTLNLSRRLSDFNQSFPQKKHRIIFRRGNHLFLRNMLCSALVGRILTKLLTSASIPVFLFNLDALLPSQAFKSIASTGKDK